MGIFIGVGSRHEELEQWGQAHLLEHLAFKGAGTHSAKDIAAMMDQLGGEFNAFTTRDYTCFYSKVLTPLAEDSLHLLQDLVFSPHLQEADLGRERQVVEEEMREAHDDLEDQCEELYMAALFSDVRLTHDILGTPESLANTSINALQDFYHRWYRPPHIVFGASGEGAEDVTSSIGRIVVPRSGEKGSIILPHDSGTVQQQVVKEMPAEQTHVIFGVKAPLFFEPEHETATLLAMILGGQNSSRLWQTLREEAGLAYTVSTGYSAQEQWAEMSSYFVVQPESVIEATTLFAEEMKRFIQEGPAIVEVKRAIIQVKTQLLFHLETPEGRLFRMGRLALSNRTAEPIERVLARLNAVTPDMVRELCRQLWGNPSQVAVAVVGKIPKNMGSLRDYFW